MYMSTKTYGHNLGLSCAFRQWRAESHCRYLHGYALQVEIIFESKTLDFRNWVVDFGSMKELRKSIENTFDHKTVIAEDDPMLDWFKNAHLNSILDLVILPGVGCEKFAEHIFYLAKEWLDKNRKNPDTTVVSVEVREHGANSGIYLGDY